MHLDLALVLGWLQHYSRADALYLGAFGLGLATAAVLVELRLRLAGPSEALKEESRDSGGVTPSACTCNVLLVDRYGVPAPMTMRGTCPVHRRRR